MIRFALRRLVHSILTLIGATLLIFVLYHFVAAHGSTVIPSITDTPAQIAALEAQPAWLQYLRLLGQWATGNFGYFTTYNEPIVNVVGDAIPETAVLVGGALLLTFAVAVPVGLFQGLRHRRTSDRVLSFMGVLFFSAPLILIGPLLTLWFTFDVPILPATAPPSGDFVTVFASFGAMVLPIVTLAIPSIGRFTLIIRSAALDQVSSDYLTVARAKGASRHRIVWNHLMRNLSIPILNSVGVALPLLLSGALVVEAMFNLPGLGDLLWQAATPKHLYYPVEISIVLLTATFVVTVNFIIDLSMYFVDPRISH
jgi:peptide/nickel transport system permease protein